MDSGESHLEFSHPERGDSDYDRRFAEGFEAFARNAFFRAHELWEQCWIDQGRPETAVSKALVQLAAAMYHLQKKNTRGCAKLIASAMAIIEKASGDPSSDRAQQMAHHVVDRFAAQTNSDGDPC